MTEADIVTKVRTLMNESGGAETAELLTDDTLKLDDYIVSVIPDAVALAQSLSESKNSLPVNMRSVIYGDAGSDEADSDDTETNEDGVTTKRGTVVTRDALSRTTPYDTLPLPDDFSRLIWLMGMTWERPCFVAYTRGSEEHKAQLNPLTRAGAHAPVCVSDVDGDGKRVMLCWPQITAEASEESQTGKYYLMYAAKYSSGEGLTGEDSTLAGICYIVASLVYRIFENTKTADEMLKVGESLI